MFRGDKVIISNLVRGWGYFLLIFCVFVWSGFFFWGVRMVFGMVLGGFCVFLVCLGGVFFGGRHLKNLLWVGAGTEMRTQYLTTPLTNDLATTMESSVTKSFCLL